MFVGDLEAFLIFKLCVWVKNNKIIHIMFEMFGSDQQHCDGSTHKHIDNLYVSHSLRTEHSGEVKIIKNKCNNRKFDYVSVSGSESVLDLFGGGAGVFAELVHVRLIQRAVPLSWDATVVHCAAPAVALSVRTHTERQK